MKAGTITALLLLILLSASGCSRRHKPAAALPKPTAFGVAIVESSGGKQVAEAGNVLPQPVVVQVNDDQGNGVTGALVEFSADSGATVESSALLTDSSGQVTVNVALGGEARHYHVIATTHNKAGKPLTVTLDEIALDYQQNLGRQISGTYCSRCHDPESTPERVSNFDNLDPKPHAFTDGATLNGMTNAELTSIIAHGGPAAGKSPQMPPYGYTLPKSDIDALIAYIRAIADPPFRAPGVSYAQK